MKLGIPINGDNTIRFKATLFALIRNSLEIKVREGEAKVICIFTYLPWYYKLILLH